MLYFESLSGIFDPHKSCSSLNELFYQFWKTSILCEAGVKPYAFVNSWEMRALLLKGAVDALAGMKRLVMTSRPFSKWDKV